MAAQVDNTLTDAEAQDTPENPAPDAADERTVPFDPNNLDEGDEGPFEEMYDKDDLPLQAPVTTDPAEEPSDEDTPEAGEEALNADVATARYKALQPAYTKATQENADLRKQKIGRASCRERV